MDLRERGLRWFGIVRRSNVWINKAHIMEVYGLFGVGCPYKIWAIIIKDDLIAWRLEEADAINRMANSRQKADPCKPCKLSLTW